MSLDELLAAHKEIAAARDTDRTSKGKKLSSLKTIADVVRKMEFDRLTPEIWKELADFLDGKHRRKRGEKFSRNAREDDLTLWNEVVSYKTAEILKGKPLRGLTTKAIKHVVTRYRIDDRDIKRRLARHQKARIEEIRLLMEEEKNTPEDEVIPQK